MKTKPVENLMTPLSMCATVSRDATLGETAAAFQNSQNSSPTKYPDRAVLILDEKGSVVGKVDMLCLLRSLEPKYEQMLPQKHSYHLGMSLKFQKTMLEQLRLWEKPMEHICQKAASKKVESFMIKPSEGEYIGIDATLDEAIHQLVMGYHESLLVADGNKIVGILKLTDVFEEVSKAIAACAF